MARSQAASRIPAPGLISGDRLQDADTFRGGGAPHARAKAHIASSSPRVNRFCRDTTFIGIRRGIPTPIGTKSRRNCCLERVSSWRRFTTWRKVNLSANPASPPASYDRLSIRLAKPESHPVGLADRIIFCVVKVRVIWLPCWRAATRRGQRPNAERMVSGVLWVGVDLGLRLEDKPHLTGLLDDVGFRDVTGSGARVRTLGRTVLFDGKNAARLQHREKSAQIGMGRVPLARPVVEGPRHQNEVYRCSWNGVRMLWAKVIRLHLAEDGLVRDALPKGGVRGIGTFGCGAGLGAIRQGRNVRASCCASVGRENLSPPS